MALDAFFVGIEIGFVDQNGAARQVGQFAGLPKTFHLRNRAPEQFGNFDLG